MRDNLSFAFFFKWFECWQKLFNFDFIHFVWMIGEFSLKVVVILKCVMPTAT